MNKKSNLVCDNLFAVLPGKFVCFYSSLLFAACLQYCGVDESMYTSMNHTNNLLNASSHHHSLFFSFFVHLCLSLFPLSLSTFLLPHKSSPPFVSSPPLANTLSHCSFPLSLLFPSTYHCTHTLPSSVSSIFFNLYLPPYTSFFTP